MKQLLHNLVNEFDKKTINIFAGIWICFNSKITLSKCDRQSGKIFCMFWIFPPNPLLETSNSAKRKNSLFLDSLFKFRIILLVYIFPKNRLVR